MANKVGRPRKFESPEYLLDKAIEFQEKCRIEEKPFLLIGLANWLGVHSDIFKEYAHFEEFTPTIKKIRVMAELSLIEGGLTGQFQTTMSIFLAKCNHGYNENNGDANKVQELVQD